MKTVKKRHVPSRSDLAALSSRSEIASIGAVVSRIMAIIRNPNSTASELMKIIEIDPPLSARLLRRANSAAYGVRRNVSSIQEAIVLLGFNAVRELAMSLKISKLFEGGEGVRASSRRMLWKHSLAVALCSKGIYRGEFKDRGDGIYSAALLHDLGVIAEDQFAWEFLKEALDSLASNGGSLVDAENAVFGFDHAALGGDLVTNWRMPEELSKAIAWHHNPLGVDPAWLRPAATICVADFACRSRGVSLEPAPSQADIDANGKILEALKMAPESVELVVDDALTEIEQLEARGELYL